MGGQNACVCNACETLNLLRLLPFIIGYLILETEAAWLVLLDLKEIVELAVAPVHNKENRYILQAFF